jgi:DNA-binding NarL/FixJ family response regulator/REP element-mobilizing transposase RayT
MPLKLTQNTLGYTIPDMAIRVLILNRQLVFAVTIKQALEQTGRFDVHPFTTAEAAFDYLRDHPQDVALVDFSLPGRAGAKIIQQMRSIQPDLAVIISPRQPNADDLIQVLALQGIIDAPFSARDVIPLIERALQMEQDPPPLNVTRPFDEIPAESSTPTRDLGEESGEQLIQRQFGVTERFDEPSSEDEEILANANFPGTRRFDAELDVDVEAEEDEYDDGVNFPGTQRFDLGENVPEQADFPETRRFDEEEEPPFVSPPRQVGKTRDLSPTAPPSGKTRPLDDMPPGTLPGFGSQTRPLDPDATRSPGSRPRRSDDQPKTDTSKLEEVLRSFQFDPPPDDLEELPPIVEGFEPPIGEGDTPSVPSANSDALRQFLATSSSSIGGEDFDNVLGEIDPADLEKPLRHSNFDNLVNSLRGDQPQPTILPERQQRQMDFIFTSGMDSVLQEIQKTKTGELPEEPSKPRSALFQRLASEEPPMPTLEESGTVRDLMLGVSDRSFRSVLSLLRGEEMQESSQASSLAQPDIPDDFFAPETGRDFLPEQPEDPAQIRSMPRAEAPPAFDFDTFNEPEVDEEASVAHVVLQTAMDDLALPPDFSLDNLMGDIEKRLAEYRLRVRPLPSWGSDTGLFKPVKDAPKKGDRGLREPDFLPEELPPGETIIKPLPEMDEPDSYTGRTTRPSSTSLENIQPLSDDSSTARDANYLDKTILSRPVKPKSRPSKRPKLPPNLPELPPEIAAPDTDLVTSMPDTLPEATQSVSPPETLPDFAADVTPQDVEATPTPETLPAWSFEEEQADYQEAEAIPESTGDLFIDEPPIEESQDFTPLPGTVAPIEELMSDEATQGIAPVVEEHTTPFVGDEDDWYAETSATDDWELTETPVAEPLSIDVSPEEAPLALPEHLDPYIAQLALNLTQVSLELTAEGTLLTRDGEIVAFSGHLSPEDAQELNQTVAGDWEASPDGARLRFITLPSSGKDYMLYSIHTTDALTLSMIFASATPIWVIRQQGQKLVEALRNIPEIPLESASVVQAVPEPETPSVPVAPSPVEVVPTTAYSCVWLLRDSNQRLSDPVAQTIIAGLTTQLTELRWQIYNLIVSEDYVYLFTGIPGETPSHLIMRDLKRRSADIAQTQNPDLDTESLWADSYLILTPGRELDMQEILDFINFQRM